MSFNRLRYDSCAYKKSLQQSTGPLAYALYAGKYNHCNKCRIQLGIVGGNAVSLYKGNLVDLESDLRGQTRALSLCPSHKWLPQCKQKCSSGLPSGKYDCDKMLIHQPSCQMFRYPPTVLPAPPKVSFCSSLYQDQPRTQIPCPTVRNPCNHCSDYAYKPLEPYKAPPRKPCPYQVSAKIPEMCNSDTYLKAGKMSAKMYP